MKSDIARPDPIIFKKIYNMGKIKTKGSIPIMVD